MSRLKHFVTPVCACLALVYAVATAPAQDDPIRLQKKVRPPEPPAAKSTDKDKAKTEAKPKPKSDALPGKADPKDELKTEDPDELEREVQETINRLSKNFRTVETKLQKKDPGAGTQSVQKDILKDLDELIDQTQKQEEQMQKEQKEQNQQQQQGQKKSGQSKRQRMMQAQRNRQQRNRTARRQQRPGQQNQLSRRQQGQMQDQPQGDGNPMGEKDAAKRAFSPKVADLYKDIWGHLPETLRQEMTQYTREQFMPKYNELLKQYYATIAEKGRKQGDR